MKGYICTNTCQALIDWVNHLTHEALCSWFPNSRSFFFSFSWLSGVRRAPIWRKGSQLSLCSHTSRSAKRSMGHSRHGSISSAAATDAHASTAVGNFGEQSSLSLLSSALPPPSLSHPCISTPVFALSDKIGSDNLQDYESSTVLKSQKKNHSTCACEVTLNRGHALKNAIMLLYCSSEKKQ